MRLTTITEIALVTDEILFECPESPERLKGAPLGMYHCPWCGCMQVAGMPHFPHEYHCWLGLWPALQETEE
jgi:hypothetical protein